MSNKLFKRIVKEVGGILMVACLLLIGQVVFASGVEYKEILSSQDAHIGQNLPINTGDFDALVVGSDNGSKICSLLKFEDTFWQDSTIIIDEADFLFEIVHPGGKASSVANRQIKISPVESDWQQSSVMWANRPAFSGRYSFVTSINTELGWTKISVKDIVQSWINGSLKNQGFAICPNSVVDDYTFFFNSSENGFPKLAIKYHYADVALGNPVDNQANNQAGNNGGAVIADSGLNAGVVNVDFAGNNNQGSINNNAKSNKGNQKQNSQNNQAIALISPVSNNEINTSKPIFEWKYVKKTVPGSKFVLILQKEGGSSWSEAITEGVTSLLWKNSLEKGKYAWYIGEWQVDRVVRQSPEETFVIGDPKVQQEKSAVTSGDTEKKEGEIKKNNDKNKQTNFSGNKVLVGVFFLLFVLVLQLGFVLYKLYKNKTENKKIKKE